MSIENFTDYSLPRDAYATFDATTLKSLIIDKLNQSEVFRDQNYEGSNINAFIDVVAYMYHVLLFYLNTTASESSFTTAQLYENMNKIVSNIGYKPTGKQTSLVNISLSGTAGLTPNQYTLKRFSYITHEGKNYTTIQDISFEKTNTSIEEVSVNYDVLHQGTITPYAPYIATGEDFETVKVVNRDNTLSTSKTFIADNTFTVFVKDVDTEEWEEWDETASLFLEEPGSLKYEKRYNENSNFEIKFGNDINGRKLKEGDIVQIYYILSDGEAGLISSNVITSSNFSIYQTPVFDEIASDVYDSDVVFITALNSSNVVVSNINDSIEVAQEETVDSIRKYAPKIFAMQNRLVTTGDYEAFVYKNYNGFVKSIKAIPNDEYTSTVLKYYYDIGLNKPTDDNRVLFNQVRYSNSTTFNNVNLFVVPKNAVINETIPNYLNQTQKQLILNECSSIKDITHNITFGDPIYKAFSLGLVGIGETPTLNLVDTTKLVLFKNRNNTINSTTLKQSVQTLFRNAFDRLELGSVVNLNSIGSQILNLNGVEGLATRRIDTGQQVPLISCLVWNPLYPHEDIKITSQNYKLGNFQYAYFYLISQLSNNIIIENL